MAINLFGVVQYTKEFNDLCGELESFLNDRESVSSQTLAVVDRWRKQIPSKTEFQQTVSKNPFYSYSWEKQQKIKDLCAKWKMLHILEAVPNPYNEASFEKAIDHLSKPQLNELMMRCASAEDPEIRKLALLCIDKGADPLFIDREGNSLLHHAFFLNDPDLAIASLTNGGDLNCENKKGFTPIPSNFIFLKSNIFRELLVKGLLDVNVPLYDKTPLWFGMFQESWGKQAPECLAALVQNKDKIENLHWIDEKGHGILFYLLQNDETVLFKQLIKEESPLCSALSAFQEALIAFKKEENLVRLIPLKKELDICLETLESLSYPDISSLRKCLDEACSSCLLSSRSEKTQEWIDFQEKNLPSRFGTAFTSNDEKYILFSRDPHLLQDVLNLAFTQKKCSILGLTISQFSMTSKRQTIDIPFFHFFGDKTESPHPDDPSHFTTQFSGSPGDEPAIIFRDVLHRALASLPQEKSDEWKVIENLYPKLIKSFEFSAYLFYQIYKKPSTATSTILELLRDRERDFILLIPLGCIKHLIYVSIDLNRSVKIHNTGEGIYHHPKLKGNRYQTTLSYKEVPQEDLLNKELWDKVIEEKNKAKNLDGLYEALEKMCRNGKKMLRSQNPLKYRQMQMQGTCATAGQMAFYMDILWNFLPGSFSNKWGFAKQEKARILSLLGNEKIGDADLSLTQMVRFKLLKKEETLKIAEIANDPAKYQELEAAFLPLLKELNANGLIERSRKTPSEKATWILLCHRKFVKKGLKDPEFLKGHSEKYFELSKLKVQDKLERREAVGQYLNVHLDKKEWELLVARVVQSYTFRRAYFDTIGWLRETEKKISKEEYASLFEEIGRTFNERKCLLAFKETWAQLGRQDLLLHMQKGAEVNNDNHD